VATSKKAVSQRIKGKQSVAEKRAPAKPHAASASASVTIDRREPHHDRRSEGERRTQDIPVAVERRALERRVKVNRRRQIDPTTCERDYTPEEIEFMGAMDEYKRRNGRMFPTCSEVLEVVKSLGYEKRPKVEPAVLPSVELPLTASVSPTVAG
jgi:hypothetical protein